MRYLKISLIIGVAATLLVALGLKLGAFLRVDSALWQFTGRPGFAPQPGAWQVALLLLAACALAWTTIDIPRPALKLLIAATALGELVLAAWVVDWLGGFFSPFAALSAGTLAAGGAFIYSRSEVGQRKRMVTEIFGDRVSLRTRRALVDSAEPLQLSGQTRLASVLVCEVFNHAALMEAMPVADYVAMMNRFLAQASELLVERGGYLDECDGESLRAVFGVPLADEEHAATASHAALDLLAKIDDWNAEFFQHWEQVLDCRIGVNSGEMVIAAYGSQRLGSFSVAGEPVEFARRLCVANGVYGSRILLGSQTQIAAAASVEVRPMELVRGRDDRYREEVYELLAPEHGLADEALARREAFWRGIIFFRKQLWNQALECFHQAMPATGHDQPVLFYIRRIEHLRAGMPLRELENGKL